MKVEWMNGEAFAIFNAVRFSSPPVERVPFFWTKGNFTLDLTSVAASTSLVADKADCGEAVANFNRIIGVIFTLQNHLTNTKSFYALGNKNRANLWFCDTVFGTTKEMKVSYGTGFWSVGRRVAGSSPASWLAQAPVAMQPMSCCWPVGALVKQEKRSPLLAFFV